MDGCWISMKGEATREWKEKANKTVCADVLSLWRTVIANGERGCKPFSVGFTCSVWKLLLGWEDKCSISIKRVKKTPEERMIALYKSDSPDKNNIWYAQQNELRGTQTMPDTSSISWAHAKCSWGEWQNGCTEYKMNFIWTVLEMCVFICLPEALHLELKHFVPTFGTKKPKKLTINKQVNSPSWNFMSLWGCCKPERNKCFGGKM